MADRYWVGGSGTWNSSDTTNWSTSSGGSGGASAPTGSDNVFFNANSGTGTVSIASGSCKNLVTTGISSSLILGDTDSTILPNEPTAITFDANTTFGAAISFIIYATSTSGNTCTLTTNGVTITGSINLLLGSTSGTDTFNLADNLTVTSGLTIQAIFGSAVFNSNNHDITASTLQPISNAAGRTIDFGTSTITLTGTNSLFPSLNAESSTLNAIDLASATIVYDPVAPGGAFGAGGSLTFTSVDIGDVQILACRLPFGITGDTTGTINSLTFTQLEDYEVSIFLFEDVEITTLNLTSYSAGRRLVVAASDTVYRPDVKTLTCDTANLTNVDFYAVTAAGTAAPFSATGDWGLNTNINFTSPATRYAVSVGGDWSDTATWSTSSGGASGASVPLPQDTAVFDANSSGTYSFDTLAVGEIDASAFTGQLDLDGYALSTTTHQLVLCSDFVISATTVIGDTVSSDPKTTCYFIGSGSHTVTTAGVTFKVLRVDFNNGTFTLGSNFNMLTDPTVTAATQFVFVMSGTLDFNDYDVTIERLAAGGEGATTIYLRSGTLTLDAPNTPLSLQDGAGSPSFNFEAGTSTILINNSSTTAKTVALRNSNILNKLVIGGGASTSQVTISSTGTNVINSLTSTRTAGGYTLRFTASTTYAIGRWAIFGKSGSLVTINSTSSGSSFTLGDIVSGGLKTSNFVALKDSNAVGANLWYAGAQSVDNGNNGAWIFETYGGGAMLLFFR